MLKRLFWWSLYAALVAVLLAGAVNRTASILDGDNQNRNVHPNGSNQTGGGLQSATGQGQATAREIFTLEGRLLNASSQGLTIVLLDGQQVELSRRAWRYAQGFGFTCQPGDALWLDGFYEHDRFEVIKISNPRSGQSVTLRDSLGNPLWTEIR